MVPPPPLLRVLPPVTPGQPVAQGGEKVGTEFSSLPVYAREEIAAQHMHEEALHMVRGILMGMARTAEKNIQRTPVGRGHGLHGGIVGSTADEGNLFPESFGESAGSGWWR